MENVYIFVYVMLYMEAYLVNIQTFFWISNMLRDAMFSSITSQNINYQKKKKRTKLKQHYFDFT